MSTMLDPLDILDFDPPTVNLRLTVTENHLTAAPKPRRLKPSYEERFERAVRRLPICTQAAFDRRQQLTIPDLVTLVRTELETSDPDVIHGEADILECKRFINAYEESE